MTPIRWEVQTDQSSLEMGEEVQPNTCRMATLCTPKGYAVHAKGLRCARQRATMCTPKGYAVRAKRLCCARQTALTSMPNGLLVQLGGVLSHRTHQRQ